MPEENPIYDALLGGGNPNSFYAAGQSPELFTTPAPDTSDDTAEVSKVAPAAGQSLPPEPAAKTAGKVNTETGTGEGGDGDVITTAPTISQRAVGAQLPQVTKYQDLIEAMNPYRALSPKDIQELRKKQKREAIFAAIGDGIAAISNLYFASQSGISSLDTEHTLSNTGRKRWDKIWNDYKDNENKMLEFRLRAMGMDENAAQAQWAREKAVEDAKIADEVRERTYADTRADRAADIAYRERSYADTRADRAADVAYREKAHEDTVKYQNRAISLRGTSGSSSKKDNRIRIQYGTGLADDGSRLTDKSSYSVDIEPTELAAELPYLWDMMPESVRTNTKGKLIAKADVVSGTEAEYAEPSEADQLAAIRRWLATEARKPKAQRSADYGIIANELRRLAGLDEDFDLYNG